MNWMKVIIAGVVAGIALTIADFVMHGIIMANAYTKYPVFAKEEANPVWFMVIAVCISLCAALLFAKSRNAWPSGLMGGLTFGFFLGLVVFFMPFYYPLVLEGFPYHLGWCWGGIDMIGFLVVGAVLGLLYKE